MSNIQVSVIKSSNGWVVSIGGYTLTRQLPEDYSYPAVFQAWLEGSITEISYFLASRYLKRQKAVSGAADAFVLLLEDLSKNELYDFLTTDKTGERLRELVVGQVQVVR